MAKPTGDKMTLDEFEQQYAERSGVTVAWLHANGRFGAPCDCGEEDCKGWQMKHKTTLQEVAMKATLKDVKWRTPPSTPMAIEDFAFDWGTRPPLAVAMEDFNAEMTQIQHDLDEYDEGYGPDGELVRVHTPWAVGVVDEQGVSLVA